MLIPLRLMRQAHFSGRGASVLSLQAISPWPLQGYALAVGQGGHMGEAFWWNWWVQLAVAVGTIGAALVALFGERIRARWLPPRLRLTISKPEGVPTPVNLRWRDEKGEEHQDTRPGRYYHVEVSNAARGSKATQVHICIVSVEERKADGQFEIAWTGELPLQWSLQQIHPVTRVVGRTAIADLCCVVKDKWMEMLPMISVLNFNARRRKEHSDALRDFIVTIQARAAEGSSPPLRLRITWDGGWSDDVQIMRRHLVINPV